MKLSIRRLCIGIFVLCGALMARDECRKAPVSCDGTQHLFAAACKGAPWACWGKTYFVPRDQGARFYQVMAATAQKRHLWNQSDVYGDLSVTLGFQNNFRRGRLSSYFLTPSGILSVGPNNQNFDVRASDLGLDNNLEGRLCLNPHYADFIFDCDAFMGWDRWVPGLWTQLRVPFVHNRFNSMVVDNTCKPGTHTYYTVDDSYAHAGGQDINVVNQNGDHVTIVYPNNDPSSVSDAFGGETGFGDAPIMQVGNIQEYRDTENGTGGVQLSLGYDFFRRERGSIGIGMELVGPAANKPKKHLCSEDLFYCASTVGSQHAWKFGGIVRAQVCAWQPQPDKSIALYADARIDALTKSTSSRMLGLRAKNTTHFNHWLLLEEYETVHGDAWAYYRGLEHANNLLMGWVKAKTHAEGQITFMLDYHCRQFNGQLGYNFYQRGAECLCLERLSNPKTQNYLYTIKGVAPVLYLDEATPRTGGFYDAADTNISATGTLQGYNQQDYNRVPLTVLQQHTLSFDKIVDTTVAAHPRYTANALFGAINYCWPMVNCRPSICVLASVELGSKNTALSLWSVMFKSGIEF